MLHDYVDRFFNTFPGIIASPVKYSAFLTPTICGCVVIAAALSPALHSSHLGRENHYSDLLPAIASERIPHYGAASIAVQI